MKIFNVFLRYIEIFISPIKTFEYLKFQGVRLNKKDINDIDMMDVFCCSWLFSVVQTFYIFIGLNISTIIMRESYQSNHFFQNMPYDFFDLNIYNISVFLIFIKIIFFPLAFYLFKTFLQWLIGFFGKLYSIKRSDFKESVSDIVLVTMTSNIFLLVPFIGNFMRFLSALFFLFIGMKKRMEMTSLQSILVLFSPFMFIFFLFAIFTMASVVALKSFLFY